MTSRSDGMRVSELAPDIFINEEEQEFLERVAQELIDILEDAEKALAKKIDEQRMDQDEYLALWSLLPAKVRTAIKRGTH